MVKGVIMTWNYRVIERNTNGEIYQQVHEVYYDKKGKPDSWTVNPCAPFGNDIYDLTKNIENMLEACKKSTLIEVEIDGEERLVERCERFKV
jgi:hypothetical protein